MAADDKISHPHTDVDASSMPAAAVQPLPLQPDNSSTSTSSAVSSLTTYTSSDTSCQDSPDIHSKPLGSTDTSPIAVSEELSPSTVAQRRTRDWSLAQEPTTDARMVSDENLRSTVAAPRASHSASPTSSPVPSSVPKSPTEARAAISPHKLDMDTSQLTIDNLREAVSVAQVSSYQHLDRKSPGSKKSMSSPIDQSPFKLREATVLPFPEHTQLAASATESTAKVQSMPAREVAKPAAMAGFSSVPTEFIPSYDDLEIPTPKLYDMALQLNADPGVGEYWRNLTKILETFYMAKRVSLIAPNDLTDIANTPWGLKGVWTSKSLPWALSRLQHHRGSQVAECIEREADNKKEDTIMEDEEDWEDMFDETEIGYDRPDKMVSPDSEEDTDAEYSSTPVEPTTLPMRRIMRQKSDGNTFDNHTADDIAGEISDNEDLPFLSRRQTDVTHGIARIYSALRPLESDIDPLIDSLGVSRVLQRGKVVLLQREYRNFQDTATGSTQSKDKTAATEPRDRRHSTALSPSLRGSVQSNTGDESVSLERPPLSHRSAFAEKKDRLKTKLKPKLRDPFDDVGANLVLQSASADLPYEDYEQALLSPWSHSPAPSPAISKDNQENPFFISTISRADDAFASPEEKATMSPLADISAPVRAIGLESSYSVIHIPLIHPSISRSVRAPGSRKRHIVPIAIISILSDVIPYPMNLVKSLTAFAPHMASSYSLAEAHSNLRYQIEMTKKINSHHYHDGSRYHNHKHHHRQSRKSSVMTHKSSSFGGVGSGSYFNLNQLSDSGGSSATSTPTWETSSGTLYDAAGANNTMTSSPTIPSSSKTSTAGPYFSATTSAKASPAVTPEGPPPDIGSQPPSQYRFRRTGKPNSGSGSLRSTSPPPKSPISSFSTSTSPVPTPYAAQSIGQEPQRLSRRKSDGWSQMPPPSPRLLRTIIDSIPVHLYIAEPETGAIAWVSARALAYCGLTPEEYCRQPQIRRFHPDDQLIFERAWRNALKKGDSLSLQLRIRRFDGAYRYFVVRAVPLRDSKGSIVHWFGTNMDIHDQRMAEFESYKQSEKLASERKYRTLAESSPLIVFTATENGGLTYANYQWLQYSGQTVEEVKKFGFLANVHPDDREKCALPNASKESQFSTEIRLRNAGGQYRWHLVRCVCAGAVGPRLFAASTTPGFKTEGATEFPGISGPVSTNSDDDQTADLAWFGTCTDINEHKLVEEKLQEAKDAAQRTMESKARFLSNMSHEIRTPLIGISGMVNFLMDTTLTAEQLDYCHTISSSSEALLSVINDILDLSKAEAGKMRLNKEWFHIRWLIEDANELLSTLAISKNLELNYIVEEDVPPLVNGDRIRIRQVLLNIIGNAIKFTSRGEIFTRCSVQKRNQHSIMLHFECHDTGAGFTKEDEILMFKPFSQIDGTMTRKHGGSGLGLVISRQLIELHGGTIHCRGEKGKGSTFYFSAEFGLPTEEDRQFSSPRPRSGSHRCSSSSANSADSTAHHVGNKRSPLSLRPTAPTVQQTGNVSTPQSLPSPITEYPLSSANPLTPEVLSPGSIAPNPSATTAERQKNIQFKGLDPRNMRFRIPSDARKQEMQGELSPEALTLSPVESTLSTDEAASEKSRVLAVVVCEYPFTTEAIIHHIRESLPSDTILETSHVTNYEAACDLISTLGSHPPGSDYHQPLTHVIINVPDYTEIVSLSAKVFVNTDVYANTKVVAITTPMQKTAILQNMRADASGASSTIPEKSNLSIDVTALSDKDSALPLTQGDSSRNSTLVDYKILEKEYATRFYCVSKPLKVSRMAAVFNPSRASSGGTGSFQCSLEEKSGSKEQSSVASRRKSTSRKNIFRELQAAVGDKGYHVLLVEDNPVNQKVLHQFLARGGLTVDTVADGEECVQKVYSSGLGYYDLIICDLHMPRKDGFHTCAELRRWEDENEVVDRVPIVALSANVMSDVAEKCAMVGFSRYVSKPIDFIVFKDVVVELLQGNQASMSSEDLST
ncbi:hypothetical protein V1508DRAFT_425327 [Lipomyces doorenjongii]|uniref:uncharacterized protein n=1 Tax=Lipomyces doorenjongii TaxID=383834 RepID=UPI0034CDC2C5